MDIESFRTYCLSKSGVTEEFPFDDRTLVFKAYGKIFALADIITFESINLKCDPEKAIELRERYPSVLPGYHMNKQHWNTIMMDGSIDEGSLREWIDDSYSLVLASLPAALRKSLHRP